MRGLKFIISCCVSLFLLAVSASAQDNKFEIPDVTKLSVNSENALSQDPNRYAIIAFNSVYKNGLSPLPSVAEDAKALLTVLLGMGYDFDNILLLENAGKEQSEDAIVEFVGKLPNEASLLFYYGGHGVAFADQKTNYMLPADFKIPTTQNTRLSQRRIQQGALALRSVVDDIKAAGVNNMVVIYDGCRARGLPDADDAPYISFLEIGGCRPNKIDNSAVYYSAKFGQIALDSLGDGDQTKASVFGRVLATMLSENPTINLPDLAKGLAWNIASLSKKATNTEQNIAFVNDLPEFMGKPSEVCLVKITVDGTDYCTDIEGQSAAPKPVAEPEVTPAVEDPVTNAVDDWSAAKAANTCEGYQKFKQNYPSSIYAIKANKLIRSLCKEGQSNTQATATATATATAQNPNCATDGSNILNAQGLLKLQVELNRLGCNVGKPDGLWGQGSQEGLRSFVREARVNVDITRPHCDFLAEIQNYPTKRICPVQCGPRFKVQGGRCVKKVCPSGQRLTNAGKCVRVVKKTNAKPKPVKPAKPKPQPQKKTTGGNCFLWNGVEVCD